jgi:hypothetical protein
LQRIPKGAGSKWENVSFPMTGDNLKHDYLQKRLPEDEKNGGYNTPLEDLYISAVRDGGL